MTIREPEEGRAAHTPSPDPGDDQGWMAMFSTLDDGAVDALLAGQPTPDGNLAPIAELAAALRRSRMAEPVPAMSAALRAQLRPTSTVVPLAQRKGRSALTHAGAVAAAAALVVVGLGVGASQNRLPTALQDVVASTADLVGVDVPTTSERPGGSEAPGRSGTAPNGRAEGEDGSTAADAKGGNGGGATPADPGTPGDKTPAVPATPPANSNGTPGTDEGGTNPNASGEPNPNTGGRAPVVDPSREPTKDPVSPPVTPAPEVPEPEPEPEPEPTATDPEPAKPRGQSVEARASAAGQQQLDAAAIERGPDADPGAQAGGRGAPSSSAAPAAAGLDEPTA